jgi:hypothetical protein
LKFYLRCFMTAVEMGVNLSSLIDTTVSEDKNRILAAARSHLQQGEHAEVLIGRLALVATLSDPDGHITTTLGAAAMLCRLLHFIPDPLTTSIPVQERALPLFAQALFIASPAIRSGYQKQLDTPEPFFPSGLQEGQKVGEMLHEAIFSDNPLLTERLLFGLYGTGADYRTLQVRTYDSIATTFQDAGHPLIFAVRGFQVLDAVEWGNRAPAIIHWIAPHLPIHSGTNEPSWVHELRSYVNTPEHDVSKIRTRLSFPKNANALPLQKLISSSADTTQVCQGVYDALINGVSSPKAVASVISLAAATILSQIDDTDRALFVHAAHGLLFSSAIRTVFQQVQDVDVLPLLFTSAAYVNALYKEISAHENGGKTISPPAHHIAGGGLIATSLLDTLAEQLKGQDYPDALTSAHRYLSVGYDARALFATIALAAARIDASSDQGHSLQIVHAASEAFLQWPQDLKESNLDILVQIAIRAALFGPQDPLLSQF